LAVFGALATLDGPLNGVPLIPPPMAPVPFLLFARRFGALITLHALVEVWAQLSAAQICAFFHVRRYPPRGLGGA